MAQFQNNFTMSLYQLLKWFCQKCEKRNARHAVHYARQEADKVYKNIDPKSSEVYRLANQFIRENTDVVGDKPVKNDAGDVNERRLKAEGLARALPKASQC